MENINIVSFSSLMAMVFTLLISCLFPVILWIIFLRRDKRISTSVLIGSVGFILSQLVIRIPSLQLMSLSEVWVNFCQNNIIASYIIYAFTAALFETLGRLLVLKVLLRKELCYYSGIGVGIGHGGVEAITLIGMTYVNNILISYLINTNTLPKVEGFEGAVAALTQTPPLHFIIAGAERVFTIIFHIAISVLLCWFITRKKTLLGSIVCIIIHSALDFIIPLMLKLGISILLTEAVLMIVAVLSVVLLIKIKPQFEKIFIQKDEAEIAADEGY